MIVSITKEEVQKMCIDDGTEKDKSVLLKIKKSLKDYFSINNVNEILFEDCGWTPLMCIAYFGNVNKYEALKSVGADINLANEDGITPLHIAIMNNKVTMVSKLIKDGADIHATTKEGTTPFILASQNGNVEIAEKLLQFEVDIYSLDNDKKNGIDYAYENGNEKLLQKVGHTILLKNTGDIAFKRKKELRKV